ncbi:MAG TPA: exosortase/archaeosortase family protein [Pyrodictium sp.]|nr:exosortase/archaeosortase family protein [Pyrodictium sp.]
MKQSTRINTFYKILLMFLALTATLEVLVEAVGEHIIQLEADIIVAVLGAVCIKTLSTAPGTVTIIGDKEVVTLVLTDECIGVYSLAVYAGLVLLTPLISSRDKAYALSFGLPFLFLLNTVRIAFAGLIGAYMGGPWFRIAHDVVGGGIMVVAVTLTWLDWVRRSMSLEPANP